MDVFLNGYKCTYVYRGNTCMHGCIHARILFEYAYIRVYLKMCRCTLGIPWECTYVWMCFLTNVDVL
jgi:hypothetical protein